MRFHDLRLTYALTPLLKNTDRVSMGILGRSQITLSLHTYGHVAPTLQRQPADMMQNVWEGSA